MIKIFQVDAFVTDAPFSGNPAAVCILPDKLPDFVDDEWMQKFAMEMNLSETSFLSKSTGGFNLRWFTPNTEVDLCGHATLASACVLWDCGEVKKDKPIKFFTKSGVLVAGLSGKKINLELPLEFEEEAEPLEGLEEALGVRPAYLGRGLYDYLVLLSSEAELRELAPNFELLKKIPSRGFIVTAQSSTNNADYLLRFFAPSVGIDEDPVTGSALSVLAPFWSKKLGKDNLSALQLSKRGGEISVTLRDGRVLIAGKTKMVFRGELA